VNNSKVLAIVDDDEAILNSLSSLVRSVGYHVRLFKSAAAFLQDHHQPPPDCLLTDVQMPGMNGLELQRAVHARAPALPVIFMTAFPEAAIREKAMRAGAHGFLHKPFEAEAILQSLAAAVEK
jgi:FixJ family two-component response regulator